MMTTGQKTATSSAYLNPDLKSPAAQEFEDKLTALIVGQDRAVRRITGMYQIFLAGLAHPGRPIGNLLFLGPTGSGKTRVVEAAAEVLFSDPNLVTKIDCAEFQHSHDREADRFASGLPRSSRDFSDADAGEPRSFTY
jgi:Cdc6-like AAA superfamily ATPase